MAAADVALMNEDSPMAGYVRIGGAGNVDDYTFEVVTGRFIVAPLGRPNAAWSSHSSFWQLLESIIKEQGGSNA
ncbi:hypothetical protein ACQVBX_02820 [Dyella sp. KULCS107]|uniref:hypothetical protein n=1 Tax=Dyella sp. KULCS107 TaxID=3422216 RepID=UPI003D6DAB19